MDKNSKIVDFYTQNQQNATDIRIFIKKLNLQYFEIRVLGQYTSIGHYDLKHIDKAIQDLLPFDGKATIAINVNPFDYTKFNISNSLTKSGKGITDNVITQINYLVIDLDPERPKDTCSTEKELNYAKEKSRQIINYFNSLGFSDPTMIILSGNGYHLY